jgi:signal transduction histidine kinase/ligand-binding sensor domain-containing protein
MPARPWSLTTGAKRVAGLLALLCALPPAAHAERLPATIYTTEHGLASNLVFKVVPDSRGFIWFATREGLSRFDGYGFTNYGVDDGLPSPVVNDFLETREGVYLVATDAGLARLELDPSRKTQAARGASRRPLFSVHVIGSQPRVRAIVTLHQSADGRIWVGTSAGLFQLENPSGEIQFRSVRVSPDTSEPPPQVEDIGQDRFGTIWVATSVGLRRLWPDGRIDLHFPDVVIHSVFEDRSGHLWAGTRLHGLVELTLDEESGRVVASRTWKESDGLPHHWINHLFELNDRELWAASPAGIIQLTRAASGSTQFRVFNEANGVGRGEIQSLARDRNGNIWAATLHAGAVKIAPSGFSAFGPADGIIWGASLMQTRSGDVCFAGPTKTKWGLYCFNGTRLEQIQPALGQGSLSWAWNQMFIEDHVGEWWFATREGVARFARAARPHDLAGRLPIKWYGTADGLAASVILRLFEDSRGDVWIASVGEGGRNGLSRWDRTANTLRHFSTEPNLPDLNACFATAFSEDGEGNVWIGLSGTCGVTRYRHGAFDRLDTGGAFRQVVRNIFRDSKERLWLATYGGLVRVDDPADSAPTFRLYTTLDGLSSNEASAVVEDTRGRLYIGTGRGIDRFDPVTGRIKRYSVRDGYTPGEITSALLDRRTGHLWFSQHSGVSRLVPPPDPAPLPPPIMITAVEVAAEAQPISPLGETSVAALRVAPHRNHLRIEYVALGFGPGEELSYQYRLEGASSDWSTPSNQRTVTFANVAPGAYRFVVRAVSADGVPSTEPASVEFTILPPVWRRWWFLTLAAAAAASLLYAAYRYRLARAIEIANVRTRIATDLHDDIGANLTKIAILSEVARQQLEGPVEAGDRLSTIARISRESVASMSDVVWAINPRHDTLRDTIRRMRQHAEEVLTCRSIDVAFSAPESAAKFRVPIDVRRDFFLIFKEALTNAVRHSQCHRITIDVRVDASRLCFSLTDDGAGFETSVDPSGNGLVNMRRRAAQMNATFDLISTPGQGTTISLSVPRSFS